MSVTFQRKINHNHTYFSFKFLKLSQIITFLLSVKQQEMNNTFKFLCNVNFKIAVPLKMNHTQNLLLFFCLKYYSD